MENFLGFVFLVIFSCWRWNDEKAFKNINIKSLLYSTLLHEQILIQNELVSIFVVLLINISKIS